MNSRRLKSVTYLMMGLGLLCQTALTSQAQAATQSPQPPVVEMQQMQQMQMNSAQTPEGRNQDALWTLVNNAGKKEMAQAVLESIGGTPTGKRGKLRLKTISKSDGTKEFRFYHPTFPSSITNYSGVQEALDKKYGAGVFQVPEQKLTARTFKIKLTGAFIVAMEAKDQARAEAAAAEQARLEAQEAQIQPMQPGNQLAFRQVGHEVTQYTTVITTDQATVVQRDTHETETWIAEHPTLQTEASPSASVAPRAQNSKRLPTINDLKIIQAVISIIGPNEDFTRGIDPNNPASIEKGFKQVLDWLNPPNSGRNTRKDFVDILHGKARPDILRDFQKKLGELGLEGPQHNPLDLMRTKPGGPEQLELQYIERDKGTQQQPAVSQNANATTQDVLTLMTVIANIGPRNGVDQFNGLVSLLDTVTLANTQAQTNQAFADAVHAFNEMSPADRAEGVEMLKAGNAAAPAMMGAAKNIVRGIQGKPLQSLQSPENARPVVNPKLIEITPDNTLKLKAGVAAMAAGRGM